MSAGGMELPLDRIEPTTRLPLLTWPAPPARRDLSMIRRETSGKRCDHCPRRSRAATLTLDDVMLRQSGQFRRRPLNQDCIPTPTPRFERGITILPRTSRSTTARPRSTSSTPRATPTSAARSNGPCRWPTGRPLLVDAFRGLDAADLGLLRKARKRSGPSL